MINRKNQRRLHPASAREARSVLQALNDAWGGRVRASFSNSNYFAHFTIPRRQRTGESGGQWQYWCNPEIDSYAVVAYHINREAWFVARNSPAVTALQSRIRPPSAVPQFDFRVRA